MDPMGFLGAEFKFEENALFERKTLTLGILAHQNWEWFHGT